MRLEVSYITNKGKLRQKNEDSLLLVDRVISNIYMENPESETLDISPGSIFAVADGMGGMPCGEVASRVALEALRGRKAVNETQIRELLREAKESLDRYVRESGTCYGMGTALAGLCVGEERVLAFNVGDCRVYRFRNALEMLTRDHTEAFELYEAGLIDETALRNHPYRNFLTSALIGGYEEPFEVYIREVKLERGDTFLICSDGLWDELSSETMEICLKGKTPSGCLFKNSYAGGRDNISFILLKAL